MYILFYDNIVQMMGSEMTHVPIHVLFYDNIIQNQIMVGDKMTHVDILF